MKKIYFNLCVIIFYGLTINKLIASEVGFPTTPPIPAPFTIPTIGRSPNFHHLKSPLYLLIPTDESEAKKLSIISTMIKDYSQCPYIPHYEEDERKKIAEKLYLIQYKIDKLHNPSAIRTARLERDKQKYGFLLTDIVVDESILVNRIHALQEYKKSAQLNFSYKKNNAINTKKINQ